MRLFPMTAVVGFVFVSWAAVAQSTTCNLDGKRIGYNLRFCPGQKCTSDYEELSFLGNKVLVHRMIGANEGAVVHLGRATQLSDEDIRHYFPEESSDPSRHKVVKQSGQIIVTYENGLIEKKLERHLEIYSAQLRTYLVAIRKETVRIRIIDCNTCVVSDASFRATLDGDETMNVRLKSSSMCMVQPIGGG